MNPMTLKQLTIAAAVGTALSQATQRAPVGDRRMPQVRRVASSSLRSRSSRPCAPSLRKTTRA